MNTTPAALTYPIAYHPSVMCGSSWNLYGYAVFFILIDVVRGEGVIEDFPGNYTDFRVYEDSNKREDNISSKRTDTRDKKSSQTKLSFNEKKEYDSIESEIDLLETHKNEIETLFAGGTLSGEDINELSIKLQEIKTAITQKEERWFELSSKLEN